MLKRYNLVFWHCNENNSGTFVDIEVLADENNIKNLFAKRPAELFKFIIDDGQEMIIPTTNINCLTEIIENLN